MKKHNSVNGSYYIRTRKSGWYLYHQSFVNGVRTQQPVDANALHTFGFKTEFSLEEAKKRCVQLNAERSMQKEKIRVAAKRVTELFSVNETLFPEQNVKDFQQLLEDENFGSEEHLQKLYSHFNFIQNMINDLKLLPSQYRDNQKRIYKYFIKKKISVNYASRLISVLNRWGKFLSKTNGSYYDDVSVPRGIEQSSIAEAQQTKRGTDTDLGVRTESLPLTAEHLTKAKDKMSVEQVNWMKLSVWFGLRPEEVDSLKLEKNYKIERNSKKGVQVIKIYQSKLNSIAKDKRWKTIPIIFKEQKDLLTVIQSGSFKRPLCKTIRKYVGPGITCYGGRKGFVDMMLGFNQKLEDISMWLGHKDISTTWKHYKDKVGVNFTETENSIAG